MDTRRSLRGPLFPIVLVAVLTAACLPASGIGTASSPPAVPSPDTVASPDAVASPPAGLLEAPDEVDGLSPASAPPLVAALPPAPSPSPTPVLPRPTEPYAMNLFASGDFVAQYTFEWCVGASIQMALNMIGDSNNRTRSRQQQLWELAQSLSGSPFGGANARGWTLALNEVGAGPYQLVSEPDLDSALRRAAAAIRETKRPVGLLMWRGRHAWVMSGFNSLGDPAKVPNFEVTGVRVLDPLYPHGDDKWGASPKPNSIVSPTKIGEQFVARGIGRVNYGIPPGYFLVLPVTSLPPTPPPLVVLEPAA